MKLYMKQKVFAWTDRFTVRDSAEQDCYTVEGKFLTIGKKLFIYDMQGREAAFIREKVLSLMPRYIVELDGREVCQIVRRFTLFRPRYTLEGIPWHVRGDWLSHEYTVVDDGENEIMSLSKRWLSWGDSYELDIVREENALLCLCVTLAIDAALASGAAASASAGT